MNFIVSTMTRIGVFVKNCHARGWWHSTTFVLQAVTAVKIWTKFLMALHILYGELFSRNFHKFCKLSSICKCFTLENTVNSLILRKATALCFCKKFLPLNDPLYGILQLCILSLKFSLT